MDTLRVSRRQLLAGFSAAAAGLVVTAACGPLTSVQTVRTPVAREPSRVGGTLIIGATASVATTNPYPSNASSSLFVAALFNTLVRLDANRQPGPELAESWTLSPDRRELVLKLRQGVMFHSGRPFSADDAKWNLDYALDLKNGAQAGASLQGTEATVMDSSTLQLRFPEMLPEIFSLLAVISMIDPQSDISRSAGGTGPFKLDALAPGDQMQLVRNTKYWRPDRPYLDAITIRTFRDPTTLTINVESGAAQVGQCQPNDVNRLKSGSETMVSVFPGAGNYDLVLSAVDPPFTDRRVRQAMSLALDRKRFAKTVMYGLTQPTYIIWPPSSPVYDPKSDTGEFNLEASKQLLADAGYPNGFETAVQGSSASFPELFQFNQIIQADLSKIGVNLSIQDLESTRATVALSQGKFSGMFAQAYGYGDQDPALLFTALPFRPDNNASRFKSDEYSSLVRSARQQPDWTQRVALYRQIADLVKEEAFVLPIANAMTPFAMRNNVHDFDVKVGITGAPIYEAVWLA